MTEPDPIQTVFRPLYGLPTWGVRRGYSSFLTLEFGEPRLDLDERVLVRNVRFPPDLQIRIRCRSAHVHGSWHLWIDCCNWSLAFDGLPVASDGSDDLVIDQAAIALNGQALTHVTVRPTDSQTVFTFDLGAVLTTWPYDDESEQWHVYEPNGQVFTLGPRGRYWHAPGESAGGGPARLL